MIYVMSSLFNAEEWAELELRDFDTRDVVRRLKHAERERTLASCCVAADAALAEEIRRRYDIEVTVPGDTMDPKLRSPEDAIVVIRPHPTFPVGKNGLAMVPLDIKLFAMRVRKCAEEAK